MKPKNIQPIYPAEDKPKEKKKKAKKTQNSAEPSKPKPSMQTLIMVCVETEDCDEANFLYGEDYRRLN